MLKDKVNLSVITVHRGSLIDLKKTLESIDRQVVYNRHSKEKRTECSRYILANLQMHKRKKKFASSCF